MFIEENLFSGLSFTNITIGLSNWVIDGGPTLSNYVSYCGVFYLVGGYNIFGPGTTFSKVYEELIPHYLARITFYFIKIDEWDNNSLIVKADNILVYSCSFAATDDSVNTQICGFPSPEAQRMIDIAFTHQNLNLTIEISTDLISNGSWGIYNISISLLECDSTCQYCVGPFEDQCIVCFRDRYLESPPGPSNCLSLCPDGYFGDADNNTCILCSDLCRTCFGPSSQECISCPRNQALMTIYPNFTCVTSCPDEFWLDKNYYTCRMCDATCQTCTGGTTSDCLTCAAGRYLRYGVCYIKCPSYTFGNAATMMCETSCPKMFYADSDMAECMPCDESCAICFGSGNDQCSKCNENYVLQGTSCLGQCYDNFYINTQTQMCQSKTIKKLTFYLNFKFYSRLCFKLRCLYFIDNLSILC